MLNPEVAWEKVVGVIIAVADPTLATLGRHGRAPQRFRRKVTPGDDHHQIWSANMWLAAHDASGTSGAAVHAGVDAAGSEARHGGGSGAGGGAALRGGGRAGGEATRAGGGGALSRTHVPVSRKLVGGP